MPDTTDDPFSRPENQPDSNAQNQMPQSEPTAYTEPTTHFPAGPSYPDTPYQQPQYPATQYPAPEPQAPQYQPSQYQSPQYQSPQYQPTQYQPPQYEPAAPAPGGPVAGAPVTGGPTYPGTPAYPGGPALYSEPPKKKRRVGLIVAIVVVGVLVLCGGAAIGIGVAVNQNADKKANASSTPTSISTQTTTATPSPTDTDGPTHDGSLVKYLIPAPPGSHADRHPLGSHNTFTAKQEAAQWQDGKDWRLDMLDSHTFTDGAVRQWVQPNTLVEVQLYHFPNANSTRGFLEDDTANADYFDKPTTEKPASNVPGGRIFYTKTKDSSKNTHALAVAGCGDVAIEVWVDQYGTVSLTMVNGLLAKQYKKLCP